MNVECAEVIKYTPESINQQLVMGKSREELAQIFGHKNYKTLDTFMRRHNYQWNRDRGIYEPRGVKVESEETEEVSSGTKKVRQVLKLFGEGKDPKEVAKEVGFKNHLALAEYMKEKGYLWNPKTHQYEPQTGEIVEGPEPKEETTSASEEEMLQVLKQNKGRLFEMLQLEENGNLPRYSLSGVRIPKTLQLSHKLNEVIKAFSEDKNISQREFFEIAALELMKKYGYEAEVKGILN